METKHKANLAILALIAAGLLAVPPETQAQSPAGRTGELRLDNQQERNDMEEGNLLQ